MSKLLIILITFWTIYIKAHAFTNNPQRELKEDELVINHFSLHKVVKKNGQHTYLVKAVANNLTSTVRREELSVMDGCMSEICVKDIMFDMGYMRYVSVEAITYDNNLVVGTSEGWNGLYQPFKTNLANTSGCHQSARRKLCVGDKVRDFIGNVVTIIAIQQNMNLVVMSNDGWNTYRNHVDADSLSVIE